MALAICRVPAPQFDCEDWLGGVPICQCMTAISSNSGRVGYHNEFQRHLVGAALANREKTARAAQQPMATTVAVTNDEPPRTGAGFFYAHLGVGGAAAATFIVADMGMIPLLEGQYGGAALVFATAAACAGVTACVHAALSRIWPSLTLFSANGDARY